ncbi:hypothetical protein B0H11DRAFT_1180177 [Mycena galericulata]|nr:hypothetical protein B0H11DRAFT_1180177 [Mycena galericulata]
MPLGYFYPYKPMKPDPNYGPFVDIRFPFLSCSVLTAVEHDRSTISLLEQLDEVSFAAGAAFLDMANIFQRLTLAQEGRFPSFTPSLDQLLSHYMHLMDATNRAHEACAKYLFSCRSALDPTDPNFNRQLHLDGAFAEFRKLCGEVRTSVADASAQWDETTHDVRSHLERDLPIPSPLEWLVCGA